MTIHVFAGPTLSHDEVRSQLDAVVSGPAAFGDVYRAAHSRPMAIAIIDGYFERVPATWHKEILWAMAEGVHVFGASSMGALRAAELCAFGMVGVGRIFEAFRDGVLEDDDEVAVAHGSAETGFRSSSDAMVNIRATLEQASREGIVTASTAQALTTLAKRTFYAERSFPSLLDAARDQGISSDELGRFGSWLGQGRVDQKRADALELLRHLRAWQASGPRPLRVSYSFESTDAWHEAQRVASESLRQQAAPQAEGRQAALLEELKLSGRYAEVHAAASARGWSLEAARRAGVRPDALAVRTAVETFRRDRALTERQAFESWREREGLDDASLTRFFEDNARVAWAEPLSDALGRGHLEACLRARGELGDLSERARRKAGRLERLGLSSPSLADAKLDEPALWRWYFAWLEREPPANLETFARSAGFADVEELRRAALREYCDQQHAGAPGTSPPATEPKPAS